MSEVYLLIYTFKFLKFLTLEHTELRVHNRDIAFGRNGITIAPCEERDDMILKTIIFCGNTEISEEDLTQYLMHIFTFFTKKNYKLFTNNCRKFSTTLLNHLDTDDNEEGNKSD